MPLLEPPEELEPPLLDPPLLEPPLEPPLLEPWELMMVTCAEAELFWFASETAETVTIDEAGTTLGAV